MSDIVDTLVREIKNELNCVSQFNHTNRMLQIPTDDIADEMMDRSLMDEIESSILEIIEDGNNFEDLSSIQCLLKDDTKGSLESSNESSIYCRSSQEIRSHTVNESKITSFPTNNLDESKLTLAGIGIPNLPYLPQLPRNSIHKPVGQRKNPLAKIFNPSLDSLDLDLDEPISNDLKNTYIWNSPEVTDVDCSPKQNDVTSEYTEFSGTTKYSSPALSQFSKTGPSTDHRDHYSDSISKFHQTVLINQDKNDELDSLVHSNLDSVFDDFGDSIDKDLEEFIMQLDAIGCSDDDDDDEDEKNENIKDIVNNEDKTNDYDNSEITDIQESSSLIDLDKKRNKNKNSHISSPFKVINHLKKPKEYIIIDDDDDNDNKIFIDDTETTDVDQDSNVGSPFNTQSNISTTNKTIDISQEQIADKPVLMDHGKIYFTFIGLKDLKLVNFKIRNAELMIIMINKYTKEKYTILNWSKIDDLTFIPIGKEISFTIPRNSTTMTNWQIKLYLRYDRIIKTVTEVTKKVPIKKKTFFHKTKYTFETVFIDQDVENNEWDRFLDSKGQFGLVKFDDTLLNDNERKYFNLTLQNEWSLGKDPYRVGTLQVETQFLTRTNNEENFPQRMCMIDKIASKLKHQQNITMSGFLLQENGDLKNGILVRRFFKLNGTKLIGYHEITNTPQIDINLLKVDSVFDPSKPNDSRNFTDVTDTILLGDSIELHFSDGEILRLTCCDDLIEQWYASIMNVVTLNVSHQPWVKRQLRY